MLYLKWIFRISISTFYIFIHVMCTSVCKCGSLKKLSQDEIKCATTLLRKISEKTKWEESWTRLGAITLESSLTLSEGERRKEGSWVQCSSVESSVGLLMNPQAKVFHWRSPASPRNELLQYHCHHQWLPRRSLWDMGLQQKSCVTVRA